MKKIIVFLSTFSLAFPFMALGKTLHYFIKTGEIIVPESEELKMRSDIIIFKPKKMLANGLPGGETPASIACIYGLTPSVPGCPIQGTTAVPTGGWGAIALVEKNHNPFAENDLNIFSQQFGLAPCTSANGCFSQVYVDGTPPKDIDTTGESALDTEWAHAMAPNAKIILVEGETLQFPYVTKTLALASQIVLQNGGGLVSMSSSQPEFSGENQYDYAFQTPSIVYISSCGDYSAPARYPASSPNVIAAGGTQIVRDGNGNFIGEVGWSTNPAVPYGQKNSGVSGGPSIYETRPAYQNAVQGIVGNARGTPDIAFDASLASGVDVYSTILGGWVISGGTSLAAPALAGIINTANTRATSTEQELTLVYSGFLHNYHSYWHDIISGYNGYFCRTGYDFLTGIGTPRGYGGK